MTHFARLGLVGSALFLGITSAQTTAPYQTRLLLDGRDLGTVSYTISGGQLLLPLTALASLGWHPVLDPYNQVVDLAGCVRVKTTGREAYLIGGPSVISVKSVSALPPLPVAPQLRQGNSYLPVKALASNLQYTVVLDKAGDNCASPRRPIRRRSRPPPRRACGTSPAARRASWAGTRGEAPDAPPLLASHGQWGGCYTAGSLTVCATAFIRALRRRPGGAEPPGARPPSGTRPPGQPSETPCGPRKTCPRFGHPSPSRSARSAPGGSARARCSTAGARAGQKRHSTPPARGLVGAAGAGRTPRAISAPPPAPCR